MRDLAALRESYSELGLHRRDLAGDPLAQFGTWFDEWLGLEPYDANAVTLATADELGHPSARVVLLKGVDHGFVFFTNYESRKGAELRANPFAALCFAWIDLERQVRVAGPVERVSEAESDDYFAVRPPGSRIGAWASAQSTPVEDREELEGRFAEAAARFGDGPVPRPAHWGGYRLIPDEVEFWQGRRNRLHDRFRYRRTGATWRVDRLMP